LAATAGVADSDARTQRMRAICWGGRHAGSCDLQRQGAAAAAAGPKAARLASRRRSHRAGLGRPAVGVLGAAGRIHHALTCREESGAFRHRLFSQTRCGQIRGSGAAKSSLSSGCSRAQGAAFKDRGPGAGARSRTRTPQPPASRPHLVLPAHCDERADRRQRVGAALHDGLRRGGMGMRGRLDLH
jgi:hypothetical protein